MRAAFVVLALCCPPTVLVAQDTFVAPGARLRVTSEHRVHRIETGRYHALTYTTLVLSRDTSVLALPLADISRVEVSRGRKPGIAGGGSQ